MALLRRRKNALAASDACSTCLPSSICTLASGMPQTQNMITHPHIQTLIDLREVIAEIERIKLQKSHGSPVSLSPLGEVIDGMIENAKINCGGASTENVFAIWECAQAAVDVYTDPKCDPEARKPSKREIKRLDRYIADAKAATVIRLQSPLV